MIIIKLTLPLNLKSETMVSIVPTYLQLERALSLLSSSARSVHPVYAPRRVVLVSSPVYEHPLWQQIAPVSILQTVRSIPVETQVQEPRPRRMRVDRKRNRNSRRHQMLPEVTREVCPECHVANNDDAPVQQRELDNDPSVRKEDVTIEDVTSSESEDSVPNSLDVNSVVLLEEIPDRSTSSIVTLHSDNLPVLDSEEVAVDASSVHEEENSFSTEHEATEANSEEGVEEDKLSVKDHEESDASDAEWDAVEAESESEDGLDQSLHELIQRIQGELPNPAHLSDEELFKVHDAVGAGLPTTLPEWFCRYMEMEVHRRRT